MVLVDDADYYNDPNRLEASVAASIGETAVYTVDNANFDVSQLVGAWVYSDIANNFMIEVNFNEMRRLSILSGTIYDGGMDRPRYGSWSAKGNEIRLELVRLDSDYDVIANFNLVYLNGVYDLLLNDNELVLSHISGDYVHHSGEEKSLIFRRGTRDDFF
jgi:hypothetical protein